MDDCSIAKAFLSDLLKMRCNSLFSGSASSPVTQSQTSSDIQANRTACFHARKSSAVLKVGTCTNDLSIRQYEEKAEAPQGIQYKCNKEKINRNRLHIQCDQPLAAKWKPRNKRKNSKFSVEVSFTSKQQLFVFQKHSQTSTPCVHLRALRKHTRRNMLGSA